MRYAALIKEEKQTIWIFSDFENMEKLIIFALCEF